MAFPAARAGAVKPHAAGPRSGSRCPPGRVRVRVLVDVDRIGLRFHEQLELVVGAVVTDEHGDGVRVVGPEERHPDARILAACEYDPGACDLRSYSSRFSS
jgi:hypothetical protein